MIHHSQLKLIQIPRRDEYPAPSSFFATPLLVKPTGLNSQLATRNSQLSSLKSQESRVSLNSRKSSEVQTLRTALRICATDLVKIVIN